MRFIMKEPNQIIPFYGGKQPDLFEIERRCMDREGKAINYLNENLPTGNILDVGAGNGFTAEKLRQKDRSLVAMEPDENMADQNKNLIWADGIAQNIPFHTNTFSAVYSTWAFFFDGITDINDGLREVERVCKPGGKIIIIDNYGNDEFCSLSPRNITNNVGDWVKRGFDYHIIETAFIFDTVEEARKLLTFYFGENGNNVDKTEIEYKIVAYTKEV